MVVEFRTLKAYPTIQISTEGKLRHKEVLAYKGTEIVTIPAQEIETKSVEGKLMVSLPRITKTMIPYFEQEVVANLMADTFMRSGIPLSRIGFKNRKSSDCSLANLIIK